MAGQPTMEIICLCTAVNASVPKTLVRHLVRYYADTCEDAELEQTVLCDVLDTPVSPELLSAGRRQDLAEDRRSGRTL